MRLFCKLAAIARALVFVISSAFPLVASSPDAVAGYVRDWLQRSGHAARLDNVSFQAIDDTSGLYIVHCRPRGFVIASGCKDIFSVVGYSFENNFDESKPNPVTRKLLSASAVSRHNKSLAKMSTDTVAPLTTALFGQKDGWNALCPSDDSAANGKTPIGCAAVATAIIMHYWKYPFRGRGTLSYEHPKYGALSADLYNARYKWDKMSATDPDSHNTMLLYHVALALKTEFDPLSAGVPFSENTTYAMKRYFGYGFSMRYFCKDHFTESEWVTMLKEQLQQGIPLIYHARTAEGSGHKFVIDGYNSDDFFHLNWGWGGNGNGYYKINNFTYFTLNYKNENRVISSVEPSTVLAPRDLTGKRQGKAIELSWKPPEEEVMLVYFELNDNFHAFAGLGFPRRITRFSASSFGLASPLALIAAGHTYTSLTSDSLFSFAVYDKDATTVLGKSPELKADLNCEMIHRFTTPLTVPDSFVVGVVPSNNGGSLASLLSGVPTSSSRSSCGEPAMWALYSYNQNGGELHMYVYARGRYLPGRFPEGGFFIERNGTIIDTLHSLETCTYRDSSVQPIPPRYRVIAFRDTTAYASLPSDSIVVFSASGKPIRPIVSQDAFYRKGNKCVVQTGSEALISLDIFNSAGKKIRTLHKGPCKAGIHCFAIPENTISTGYYVVRFLSGKRAINVPFIVQ